MARNRTPKVESCRASSADAAVECPSVLLPCAHPYNPDNDIAREGSAGHEASLRTIAGEELSAGDVTEISERWGVETKTIYMLRAQVLKLWDKIKPWFPDPQIEVKVRGPVTHGSADVVDVGPEWLRIVDLKLGWLETPRPMQLRSYADAAREQYGWDGPVDLSLLYGRRGVMINERLEPEQLDGFRERMRHVLKRVGKDYAPGSACTYCPRQLVCEAREDHTHALVASFVTTDKGYLAELTDDKIAAILPKVKQVKSLIDAFDKALGARLKQGPVDLGDRELYLATYDVDTIAPLEAWRVLAREPFLLTDDDMARCLKLGKKELLAVLGDKAPKKRGAKGQIREAALAALAEAGAITTEERTRRDERAKLPADDEAES